MTSWYKSKVLIPGGGGYIGQVLGAKLDSLGVEHRPVHTRQILTGNWKGYLSDIDVVIYLAAQTDANYSNEEPGMDWAYNVNPFLEMLETIQKYYPHIKVVFTGAVTQVGFTNAVQPSKLTRCDRPITIYDIHKLTCEHYLRFFCRDHNIQGVTLRLANVYGPSPGESKGPRGFLNRMVKSAIRGQGIEIFTGLVRDYIYIDDVVEAILACLDNLGMLQGRSYEIGSGVGYNICDVADVVAELVGGVQVDKIEPPTNLHPIEMRSYVCNIEPFVKATDWRPQIQIKEGLERTVEFYG